MELTHLRYFCFVAQTGSFRAGAARAHVSAPAMTKAIQRLEDDTGARLFERTTRRVILTEAGQAVFDRAREILSQVDGIRRDLDGQRSSVTGELRVGAMEVFSVHVLPRALAALVKKHPDLRPLAYEMHPASMARELEAGRLDVGFTIGAEPSKTVDVETLGTSRGVVVCGRGHPLFDASKVGRAEILRHPFVVPRFFEREYLPSLDQFPDDVHPRVVGATIELMQMGIELVTSGRYLGCFPEICVEHHLASGALRSLAGITRLPRFELQALTRKGAPPKRSAALLIAELRGLLRAGATASR